jgi:hypothetical protein
MVNYRRTRKKRGYSKRRKRTSITANRNAIEGIKRSLRADKNQYGLYHEYRNAALSDAFVPVFPAMIANSYSPAWGNWGPNSSIAVAAGRVSVPSVHISMAFTINDEAGPVRFNIYHVKLRPAGATALIEAMTETLPIPYHGRELINAGTDEEVMIRGTFSTATGIATNNAAVRLNPRYWEVKKHWAFSLGLTLATSSGTGTNPTTTLSDGSRNIEYTVPMGNQQLGSPNSVWTGLDADAYKNENLNYILIYTDNSALDADSPSCNLFMSTIVTARE